MFTFAETDILSHITQHSYRQNNNYENFAGMGFNGFISKKLNKIGLDRLCYLAGKS